ncbi:hypothetical protein HA402_007553 [Bradysia odoriphaga]|nr:hypothetical protein HA402_007553 [Bradysia odoriphaga]
MYKIFRVDELHFLIFFNQAMDLTLFLIKDEFPSSVIPDLPRIISKLDGLKIQLDFKAYIVIEFVTPKKAEEAREKGIKYVLNRQQYHEKFADIGRVHAYVQDKFREDVGKGFPTELNNREK